jgi:hypothetical protein
LLIESTTIQTNTLSKNIALATFVSGKYFRIGRKVISKVEPHSVVNVLQFMIEEVGTIGNEYYIIFWFVSKCVVR